MQPVTETLNNGWEFNVHPHVEYLSPSVVEKSLDLVRRWAAVFPREETWVQQEHGVPSLFIRIDATLDDNGNPLVYEPEDRPCGMGAMSVMDPTFARILNTLQCEWPKFDWVSCAERNTDDVLWLGPPLSYEAAMTSKGLLLPRNRPEDSRYHPLVSRAVSTVATEGSKRCLEQLGLLRPTRWVVDPDEQGGGYLKPTIDGPLVVKPAQGTRSREIQVFLDGKTWNRKKRARDTLGLSALEKQIRSGRFVCQPFFPPMPCDFLGSEYLGWNMIYRYFFGFVPKTREWVCLGGLWMALDSLIVHGTNRSVSGLLHMK